MGRRYIYIDPDDLSEKLLIATSIEHLAIILGVSKKAFYDWMYRNEMHEAISHAIDNKPAFKPLFDEAMNNLRKRYDIK